MHSNQSQQSGIKLRKLLEDYYSHIDRFVDALQAIHIQAQKIAATTNPEKVAVSYLGVRRPAEHLLDNLQESDVELCRRAERLLYRPVCSARK